MLHRCIHISPEAEGVGGATVAALRIHHAMKVSGVQSKIVCWDRPKDADAVYFRVSLLLRMLRFAGKVFFRLLRYVPQSTGFIPSGLYRQVNALPHDIVVLHWIQLDTLSMREILRLKKPVLWYHHDLWPIRGLTPHSCYKVPKRLIWLDRIVLWNKRLVAKRMGARLIPVCASEWVAQQIRISGMYAVEPIVIPLPLDPVFSPGLRCPAKVFRILHGARGGFSKGLKGGDRLLAALKFLTEDERLQMEVVVFGESKPNEVQEGVCVRYVGKLHGEKLAQQYRDADVFAFPSRQETFGQTKLEALACGTPVIAFDETACAEGVAHKINGWIAPADDIKSYAEGIRYFYYRWKGGNPVRVAGVDSAYSMFSVAKRWHELMDLTLKTFRE